MDRYYLLGAKYWWWTVGVSLIALFFAMVLSLPPFEKITPGGFMSWMSLAFGHHYTIYMLDGCQEYGGIEKAANWVDKAYLLIWSLFFVWAMPAALFGFLAGLL